MLQLFAIYTVLLIKKQDRTYKFMEEGWWYGLNTNRTRWEYADVSSNAYFGAVTVVIGRWQSMFASMYSIPQTFFSLTSKTMGQYTDQGVG